jgi:hypothetical protein
LDDSDPHFYALFARFLCLVYGLFGKMLYEHDPQTRAHTISAYSAKVNLPRVAEFALALARDA